MADTTGNNSVAFLCSFVERIECLEEERRGLADDIREVYAEAKSNGLDPKIMRKVVALRKLDPADREETEALVTLYMETLEKAHA